MMDLVNTSRIEGSGVGGHVGKVWTVREEDREKGMHVYRLQGKNCPQLTPSA